MESLLIYAKFKSLYAYWKFCFKYIPNSALFTGTQKTRALAMSILVCLPPLCLSNLFIFLVALFHNRSSLVPRLSSGVWGGESLGTRLGNGRPKSPLQHVSLQGQCLV